MRMRMGPPREARRVHTVQAVHQPGWQMTRGLDRGTIECASSPGCLRYDYSQDCQMLGQGNRAACQM